MRSLTSRSICGGANSCGLPGVPPWPLRQHRFSRVPASKSLPNGRRRHVRGRAIAPDRIQGKAVATDEKLNTFEEITGYNNFYEFGTGKSDPQALRRAR